MTQAAKLAALGSAGVATGFKNRIINGAMMIDQRNAGASLSVGAGGYTVDRWAYYIPNNSGATIQQVSDAPAGFINSLKFTVGTGIAVNTQNEIYQPIEGLNVTDLAWGTSSAKTITLSFWVKSSLTGTFNCSVTNQASNRSYVSTYTIPVANTWTQASVTIPGDTTGTWLTNNGTGVLVIFSLGQSAAFQTTANTWTAGDYKGTSGAVSVVATTGATWQVTGVQLEVGTTATTFDFRAYGTELALCQRYCYVPVASLALANGTITSAAGGADMYFKFPVSMRSGPTLSSYPSVSTLGIYSYSGAASKTPTGLTTAQATADKIIVTPTWSGTFSTAGYGVVLDSTTGLFVFSAEL